MSTIELKQQLIDKIESIENDTILEEVYRILDIGNDNFDIYQLSEEENNAIEEGQKDIQSGKVTSHEDAKNEIEQWLSK